MQASVKIMDIDVDMLSNDVFIQKIDECLSDEKFQVIFFVSTEMLNRAVEEQEYREILENAELVLPGEEALLSSHHVEVLEAGDMVVSCKSFGLMLENLQKEARTIYIVSKSEAELALLQGYCKRMQPELQIVGTCVYDVALEDAAVVNEINSHVPDFLLVDMESGIQEQWIQNHSSLLNAKLCVAIGGVAGLIMAQQKQIPGWVRKLHLGGIYHAIFREQKVKKGLRARVFRKKVKEYHSSQEEKNKR